MNTGKLKTSDLPPVARTLLIPLTYRAIESRRLDAIVRDERAVVLIAQFDEEVTKPAHSNRMEQVATLMRARQFDQIARQFLAAQPEGAVVDIGCGLDTHFDRIDDTRMRWLGLDLPEVIALRQQLIPEIDPVRAARRWLIAGLVLDLAGWTRWSGWAGHLPGRGGVRLLHRGRGATTSLALAQRFPGAELVFDAGSPRGCLASRAGRTELGCPPPTGCLDQPSLEQCNVGQSHHSCCSS